MTLVRWDPFREVRNLSRVFFDDAPVQTEETTRTWAPAVDIFETEDSLTIRAELPGVKSDEINVEVNDGVLTITGERKREDEIEGKNAYRLERVYGKFTRRFSLPRTVDSSKVGATHRNGVLSVVLPKADEAKPRQIEIEAA